MSIMVDTKKLYIIQTDAGLSNRQLAKLADMDERTVRNLYLKKTVNPSTLKKLADVLGFRPSSISKPRRKTA